VHSTTLPPTRKDKCWLCEAVPKMFLGVVQDVFSFERNKSQSATLVR